ncbi:MAG: DUF503 domain-containing protein [Candidatus Binatia bacterium]
MIVGVLKLSLVLAENHSLKGKRGVVRRIQARVSHQFNISVTECGDQDLWQSAVLGFGMVGSNRQIVETTLQKVVDFIDNLGLAQVGESEIDFFYC